MGSPLPGSPAYRAPLPPGFEPPTSGKAIGSLICGFFLFFLPASIVAIILGHLSLSEIRKSAGRLKGQGIATAGLVLGYLGVAAIPFLLIIAAIAIPNLMRSKIAANETSAVGSLRSYNAAIFNYSVKCPKLGYPSFSRQLGPEDGDCMNLRFLPKSIDRINRTGTVKSGYLFVYSPSALNAQGQITSYSIWADPVSPNVSGIRHFFTDQTGVIRVESNKSAGMESDPL
jgi:hypothetical protein